MPCASFFGSTLVDLICALQLFVNSKMMIAYNCPLHITSITIWKPSITIFLLFLCGNSLSFRCRWSGSNNYEHIRTVGMTFWRDFVGKSLFNCWWTAENKNYALTQYLLYSCRLQELASIGYSWSLRNALRRKLLWATALLSSVVSIGTSWWLL